MTTRRGQEKSADADELGAALAGDESAFAALVERHRPELHLHCYRFLGSTQDAEDLVQETFLRAWAKRASFQGRSTFRAWLYGIATNACLDALRRRPRRVTPPEVTGPADPGARPGPATDLAWLEPYPDRLIEDVVAAGVDPEAALVRREATELAFLAAMQHLPPRQRAVLILRDVVEWSAKETAGSLNMTVASANSALQRARETLRRRWVRQDAADRRALARISEVERSLLARMVDAWNRTDINAVAALLGADARLVMPPTTSWYDGRAAVTSFLATHAFTPSMPGRMRAVPTAANRQPALGVYIRDDSGDFRPFALLVLTVESPVVTEMTLFHLPRLFPLCGLPTVPGP
ncbi:sigma-70 family RNA polymerase sigma factor [Amycolatopsis acidiphila]|uniref:RNA polymerase sigma factor n=1 Tax=Amycolatopsis acidiphila TaxID=715473 RepID=A0A558AB90_9PSEU|nr:sigma-70 family RNA polymerase sigma factor [Amycolatopsis acidiphila]